MSTLDTVVRSGKVRAIGLSDVPAWYVAKAQTLAEARNLEPVAALQLEYSLVERNIEREHIPAAGNLGIGIIPWSPLAHGFLSGKYTRAEHGTAGDGRLRALQDQHFYRQQGDRGWGVLDTLRAVADEVGRTPAQVALNWISRRPSVTSVLIGARTIEQVEDNLAALDFDLTSGQANRLDEAGAPELLHPYTLFDARLREARIRARGGAARGFTVADEPKRY
jgi:aryl-alcohol dehydrogenase-like predicted oxidoreductase